MTCISAGTDNGTAPAATTPMPSFGGGIDEHSPVALQIGAQPVERVDHTAVHLDHAALQLGHVVVGQLGQQFRRAGGQPSGLEVDEVEFLLDAQCSRHDASQFVTAIDAQSHQC